jgi:acyl carrier protein
MLNAGAGPAGTETVEALVLDEIAALCRAERGAISLGTQVVELAFDSLTLIGLLTRLEVALGVSFDDGDALAIMAAGDVGSVCARVRSALAKQRGKFARNAQIG